MVAWSKVVVVVAFPLSHFICGSHSDDKCVRAMARLARINAARSAPPLPDRDTRSIIRKCQRDRNAAFDPILSCAIESATDQEAAACIDRFRREVLQIDDSKRSSGSSQPAETITPLLSSSFRDMVEDADAEGDL